ncbi:MAG: copper chaperone PCu(A)C [Polaromonas sp.]|jgi:copper(I)-binding protein
MTLFKSTSLVLITTLASLAFAQTPSANVEVKDAWVRGTVPGQKGTGAFMKITAKDGAKLVGVSSPVAGVGEVHEMKMEGDVMKMRALPLLDLPAGKAVELKPGGYHVMLMDLKQALVKDSKVPLTLVFKDAKGVESKMELSVPVSNAAPAAASGTASDHKH